MKLIKPKYWKLQPSIEYINDEVVIAQAWKKTHSYMRTHNWYADTLALDVSALSLEYNVNVWAKSITESSKSLTPLELITAAKSDPWKVSDDGKWESIKNKEEREKKTPIRPLAHLTVRDQTWATSILLCLADYVETKQGDCAEKNFFLAQKKEVYSYGNRLICDWKNDEAYFRWGNSEIYRKFFVDYQSFLRRPVEIGREIAASYASDDNVYVVSMDITRFYDCIDRENLQDKLKAIIKKQGGVICEDFWGVFSKVTNWQWANEAKKKAEEIGLNLGQGLPQGLVASGFFANAYMLDFDAFIGSKIGATVPGNNGILIHDYCRYVDDIRFVISIENTNLYNDINEKITKWINKSLENKAGKGIRVNLDKTKVTSISDLDNNSSVSSRLEQLQTELSGPADRDVLENSAGALEGLLSMKPDFNVEYTKKTKDIDLINIVNFDHDVRDDTLKRFAANRLANIMIAKRRIEGPVNSDAKYSNLDNESELIAKKLILAWMKDPSLSLVLRKAFEIFPSVALAEPVFESICKRCSFSDDPDVDSVTSAAFDYLLADLFRSCIDFHGYFQRVDYPKSSNPEELIDMACIYAQRSLEQANLPKFIQRQALMLLAVAEKPVRITDDKDSIHKNLHVILGGQKIDLQPQLLALYEIAAQISGRADTYAKQLLDAAAEADPRTVERLFNEFSKRGGVFWEALWRRAEKNESLSSLVDKYRWAAPEGNLGSVRPVKQNLSKLIHSKSNVFINESALIKLGLSLVSLIESEVDYCGKSPRHLIVKQKKKQKYQSWDNIVHPDFEGLDIELKAAPNDPRFQKPDWIEGEDAEAVYWIGNILRSAAVGSTDFTSAKWRTSSIVSYKGLRTGWYKRRMGMMHAPEALVGEIATLSEWSSELLKACLQWPGFQATYVKYEDVANIQSLEMLKAALKSRLLILNSLYCHAIKTPALLTKVARPKTRHKKGFRLVSVQQLLPRTSAFSLSDPKLDSPIQKAANRDHLARICQLTYKTLEATLQAEKMESYPGADLIVFPELSVHQDDQDLLKRLADKSQSMVFAGLVFKDHEDKLVNVARWFIPDYKDGARQWIIRDQGKAFPTDQEKPLGVEGFRPCQQLIEVQDGRGEYYVLSGAICYDATDLNLAADLKGITDLFIVAAHNKDVRTFDAMAGALNYHMYQHVVVVNKGEFGGSTIQAPYKESFERLVAHSHGTNQISISIADLDLGAFKRANKKYKEVKTPPANWILKG